MAINLEQAMRDIYGDSYKSTTNTTNTSKTTSTLPVKQSSVSQPKTSTKNTGTITLASAFNDIYGDDTAYDTYLSNKAMYQPAVTDDENLQKKQGFWRNLFQTSKYYEDGYDKGDFLRTVGDTGKSALSSIAEGFLNTVEGIADWGQYRVSDVLDFFGATNAAQNVKENAQFNSTAAIFGKNTTGGDLFESGWKESIDKGSVLGQSGQQIFEGIGNIAALAGSAYLGGQAIGGIAPAATTTTFGQSTLAEIGASSVGSYVSAYGNARSRALNEGYSDADAKKAGVVSGLAEAISEQFFNGMTGLHTAGLGETVFGKVVPKTVTESMNKFFSTKAGKVVSVILDGVEEGSEEIISNILTATGNDIAHLIDPNYSANGMDEQTGNWWKDVRAQVVSSESWDAFFSAMITSALLGGANTMINEDNKPLLNSKQRQELIEAYAKDNNMTVDEAKGRLDLQESVQGKDDKTIERTVYSNVDISMDIAEIQEIKSLKDLQDLESQLQEVLTQDRDTRTMTREELEPIVQKLNAVRAQMKALTEQMTPVEKADELNTKLDEIQSIEDKATNNMENAVDNKPVSPEVLVATDDAANDLAQSIDKDTTIPVAENKKDVRADYKQVEEAAIEYINQLNAEREAQGQPRITIIQNLNQEQVRIADALMALGRHVIFAKDLPGSFVTPTTTDNNQLNRVLYISDKINTGLLATSSVANKNQAMTYAVGHELFHSLRMREPGVYDNFVKYVANTLNDDQIVRFMEMYDPQDSQNLLKNLQIDGQFNLEEVLTNPKKHASQYQALLSIAEEMTANEFGGMLTDVEYMTNLANQNESLFKKVVNAIKKFFKDLDKPIYNSTLTQYQISTIRQNFEDIAKNAGESLIAKNATNSLSTTQGLINEIQSTKSGQRTTNDVQTQETLQKATNKLQREQKPKSTRQTSEQKTTWADVTKAYDVANRSDDMSSVTNLREVYDKYLKDGGKQDAEFETLIDGLENAFKTPKPTRQKLEKVTQQVNTSEQVEKSTRQKLPTKEVEVKVDTAHLSDLLDKNLRGGDVYLAFEDTIVDNDLSDAEIKELKKLAVAKTDLTETKNAIRNWTPETMEQENAEIEETKKEATKVTKETNVVNSLSNLYYQANENYTSLLQSGLSSYRDKALKFYKEYKEKGGKKVISGLEETQEKPALPKKETVTPQEEVKVIKMSLEDRWNAVLKSYERYKNSPRTKQEMLRNGLIASYNAYKNAGGTETISDIETMAKEVEGLTQQELEDKSKNLFKDMMLSRGTMNDNGTVRFLPNVENRLQEVERVKEEARARNKKVSAIFSNTFAKSPLSKDIFNVLRTNSTFTDYDYLSDEQSLQNARDSLADKGEKAILEFFSKSGLDKNDNALAEILLSYYSATNDVDAQVAIWEKIRPEGTRAAQFLQSFNMLKKLSPEAMVQSIQVDLDKLAREMRESKDATLQAWIAEKFNNDKMKLTEAEKTWIREMWKKANNMKLDSIEYKKTMAQIYAYIANKVPKSRMSQLKEYRRIAMLGNIKTMGRNILSNVFALPVNIAADFFGAQLDKKLAQQTGMRTQGTFKSKNYWKGHNEGTFEAKEDYRLKINTQNINAYDRQNGRMFNNDKLVGKVLNKASDLVNYFLDLGDRPFEKGYERNSLANIMTLNKHETATALDKQLAFEEAETKVWKNKGKMADLAINTRQTLNKVHIGEFGLGDLILPFVLTPANLAAATYHYSPAAVISVGKNFRDFNKILQSSTATHADKVLAQKKAVDSFGKMAAGTIIYAIAFAIAKAGVLTGEEDDDKDVAALMNSMGWKKYSVKIGDKYVSYDWAQPFANPFAIMAEINQQRENGKFTGDSELEDALQAIAQSFKLAGSRIQDQSFLASLQSIFSGKESIATGLIDFAADVPASFIPTASKQLADIIDGRVKTTYDKNNIGSTALNKLLSRIPGAKSLLPNKRTTLGADLRYQEAENLLGNIFWSAISPANSSTNLAGEIGSEFFDVYSHTGDKTIMPQIAVNYITYDSNSDGKTEKYQFSPTQQSDLQKAMGDIVTKGMQELLFNDVYNTASYTDKATALTSLVQYAKGKALEQSGYVLNYKIKSGNAAQINKFTNAGLSVGEAVMFDSLITGIKADKNPDGTNADGSESGKKAYAIMNMAVSDDAKNIMLYQMNTKQKTPETVDRLKDLVTEEDFVNYYSLPVHDAFVNDKFSRDDLNIAKNYFNFNVSDFATYANELSEIRSDKDANGNTISNSKKNKIVEYLNSLPINPIQKTYLLGVSGYSLKPYTYELRNYINSLNISAEEKQQLWTQLGFK